jgi:hypothetical protein
MKRRSTTIVMVLAAVLLVTGLAPASALQPEELSLVRIAWNTDKDLALVEASGVPVYARLEARGKPYFLAGATAGQAGALRAGGLDVTFVDPTLEGAGYYLASVVPGRPAPDWSAFGRLLLDDGTQVLLRTSAQDAERLVQLGVEIAAVTLTPKPVKLAAPPGGTPEAVEWDPLVQAMIDQVATNEVSDYDRQMAGELPVWVDGAWYTITSRYTYSGTPIQKATSWVGQHMAELGLDVEYHNWGGASYPNVIGELPGLTEPDDIFIIGGHIDDVSGSPGADDNGSGSVATLLAADIMSQYQWGCTLRFAFWTGEEQGLNGSYAYAQRAYNNGENILGYLNLDMIAWNTLNSARGIDLYYSTSVPGTQAMAQQFADAVSAYNLGLIPQLGTGVTGSDHYSFWQFGYKSILGIEDNGDFNPYYHSSQDTPAHTDLSYFTDFVKASIADYAHLAGCLIPEDAGTLEGTVTDAATGNPIAGATVIAQPAAEGSGIQATTDPNGFYSMLLLPGTYNVAASKADYYSQTVNGVVIVADQTTVQDFALQPLPPPQYLFCDDMESGSGNWTHNAAQGTDDWAIVTTSSHSPTHAWYTADVSGVTDKRLWNTAPVAIPGAVESATLAFWHRYGFESGYDGSVVEISTDGGATGADVGSKITQNGYNSTLSSGSGNPLGGRQAWSGTAAWNEVKVDLSAYIGMSVQVRFRIGTDVYLSGTGWWIDDVCYYTQGGAADTMHVGALGLTKAGTGPWTLTAKGLVHDTLHAPLSGVQVQAQWLLPNGQKTYRQFTTVPSGGFQFQLTTPAAGQYRFCVVNLIKTAYTYVKADNHPNPPCRLITTP